MSGTILIIDHDTELAQALGIYLERQKYRTRIVRSVESAGSIMEYPESVTILADPGDDNSEAVAALKKISTTSPHHRLIIYSKPDRLEKWMAIFQDDAFDYLRKPVSGIALDLCLRRAQRWDYQEQALRENAAKIKELKNTQALFQQLFDEVPCYITVQDKNFRITATNRLFKRDFGHEIGEFCFQIYKHRLSRCADCPVAATFIDGRRHQTEEVVTSKSGEQFHVLTWTAPIKNEAGEITQVMEMATNITQIRQLQDHLTSLGLMLGSMSHGIRGMLTALDGGLYLLDTGIRHQDPDRTSRALDQVRQMVAQIRKMVLDILYFTKSRKLEYQRVDLRELVHSASDTITPTAERNGIVFTRSFPSGKIPIDVDPVWFRSALVNFLENAVDACLSDADKSQHSIDFKVFLPDNDHVCFEIADNGMGMNQETREKMFTLFFSSKGSKGTGLGLFVSNHVIRQHGGSIHVESQIKTGSLFKICIPRIRETKASLPFSEISAKVQTK